METLSSISSLLLISLMWLRSLVLLVGLSLCRASHWGPVTTFGNHRYSIPIPPSATPPSSNLSAFTAEIAWRRSGSNQDISNGLVLFCGSGDAGCVGSVDQTLQNATVLNSSRFSAVVAVDPRELPAGTSMVHAY